MQGKDGLWIHNAVNLGKAGWEGVRREGRRAGREPHVDTGLVYFSKGKSKDGMRLQLSGTGMRSLGVGFSVVCAKHFTTKNKLQEVKQK